MTPEAFLDYTTCAFFGFVLGRTARAIAQAIIEALRRRT